MCSAVLFLPGCAGLYFRDAPSPEGAPPRYDLAHWPYEEYWTGLVFNGQKVGFSHIRVEPADEPGLFAVSGEMVLAFRFMTLSKRVTMQSRDLVRPDLTLHSFRYDFNLDGNRLVQEGRVLGGELMVRAENGGETVEERHPLAGPLHPLSIVYLYPLLHGLEPGRLYRYSVYDGETRTLDELTQQLQGWEEAPKLYSGPGCKVETTLHGLLTEAWLDARGRPLFESAMGGVMLAGLEPERLARRYLAEAALSKAESFIEFSLIRTNILIENPREVRVLDVRITGLGGRAPAPGGQQQCRAEDDGGYRCRMEVRGAGETPAVLEDGTSEAARRALLPSPTAQSANPEVVRLAREVAGGEADRSRVVEMLLRWVYENVEKSPQDVFSALDVLATRKAECQGHALLYTALARAAGVPTRVANGIVYSEDYGGFLYHTWAESLVDGVWQPVDPTFGQTRADATHIKLLDGEGLAELAPLADIVGKVRVEVLVVGAGE